MYNHMVVYQSPGVELTDEEVDRIFRALADSTRRDILRRSLMEEFARLSERHEAGKVSPADYDAERTRILGELGIES